MAISCHFRDCKALLVLEYTPVSSAIATTQTLYLSFIMLFISDNCRPLIGEVVICETFIIGETTT